jgi:GGDEF domain-containing protein
MVDRVSAAVRAPLEIDGETVTVEVSIGVALATGGDGEPDALVREADAAMLRTKDERRAWARSAAPRRAELRVGPLVVGWRRREA